MCNKTDIEAPWRLGKATQGTLTMTQVYKMCIPNLMMLSFSILPPYTTKEKKH